MKKQGIYMFLIAIIIIICSVITVSHAEIVITYELTVEAEDIPLILAMDRNSEGFVDAVETLCRTDTYPYTEYEKREANVLALMNLLENIQIPLIDGRLPDKIIYRPDVRNMFVIYGGKDYNYISFTIPYSYIATDNGLTVKQEGNEEVELFKSKESSSEERYLWIGDIQVYNYVFECSYSVVIADHPDAISEDKLRQLMNDAPVTTMADFCSQENSPATSNLVYWVVGAVGLALISAGTITLILMNKQKIK